MTTEQQFHIQGIPPALVDKFWPFAEPYIKRALDHSAGEYSHLDLKEFCKNTAAQLWLITHHERVIAAVTTQLIAYPKRSCCRIITLAGSHAEEWTEPVLLPAITAWAKTHGCTVLDAQVRKGYVPKLIQYGFKHKCSTVFREI